MSDIQEKLARALCWSGTHCSGEGCEDIRNCPYFGRSEGLALELTAQGLAIVPLEPTKEMCEAGEQAVEDAEDSTKDTEGIYTWIDYASAAYGAYKAMILNQDPKPR